MAIEAPEWAEHAEEMLLAFARAQQAKGIRIVEREMRQSGNTKLAGWIVWCEAQATAREKHT